MEIQAKITKEEVSALPPVLFEGRIVLVEDMEALGKAYDRLSKEEVIGFDTETRPSFKKGVSNKVALMQLSTDEVCYLFRLNKIGFAGPLIRLMQSRKVKKIGLSSQDDILMLRKRVQFRPAGFVELQKHVNEYGIEELSLQEDLCHPIRKANLEGAAPDELGSGEADGEADAVCRHRRLVYATDLPVPERTESGRPGWVSERKRPRTIIETNVFLYEKRYNDRYSEGIGNHLSSDRSQRMSRTDA